MYGHALVSQADRSLSRITTAIPIRSRTDDLSRDPSALILGEKVFGESLSQLITSQRTRPLSLVVAALALFVPSSLTVFLAKPSLFTTLGLHGVLLLSVAISLPIVVLCFGIWYTPLHALLQVQRISKGASEPAGDLVKVMSADDPLEWPSLLAGSWTALFVLYVIAVIAYYRPLEIGTTYLLTAAILFALWVVAWIASLVLMIVAQRKRQQSY